MAKTHWHERWDEGRIGFHLDEVHPELIRHFGRFASPARILVPLAGRSHDILWLRDNSEAEVIAVELVEGPVNDFHRDHGIDYDVAASGPLRVYRSERLTFIQGDFFEVAGVIEPGSVDLVYDRAAIVALPPEARRRYVALLLELMAAKSAMLLVSIAYDQSEMSGPPFAVHAEEVRDHYSAHGVIEHLGNGDILNPRFAARGVTSMWRDVWDVRIDRRE